MNATPLTGRPLRVLCADDNAMLGDVMLCLLARAGYWVEHVEDGLKAWDRIAPDVRNFDVVVTDHQMPTLNGLELVELLRQASFPGRIVVYSSSLTPSLLDRYRAFGVTSFVTKASRSDELLGAINGAAHA